jgi:hypothetical protein
MSLRERTRWFADDRAMSAAMTKPSHAQNTYFHRDPFSIAAMFALVLVVPILRIG